MRFAVYNRKDIRNESPDQQKYIREGIDEFNRCRKSILAIFGYGNNYYRFHDFGAFPGDSLDRPGLSHMLDEIDRHNIDGVCALNLSVIATEVDLILDVYSHIKKAGIPFITVAEGKRAMAILDRALALREEEEGHDKQ